MGRRSGPASWRQPVEAELRRARCPQDGHRAGVLGLCSARVVPRVVVSALPRFTHRWFGRRAESWAGGGSAAAHSLGGAFLRPCCGANHLKCGPRLRQVVFIVALVIVSPDRSWARSMGSVVRGVAAPSGPSYEPLGKMGDHAAPRPPRSSGRDGRVRGQREAFHPHVRLPRRQCPPQQWRSAFLPSAQLVLFASP